MTMPSTGSLTALVHAAPLSPTTAALAPDALVAAWLEGKDAKTVRAYRADLDAFAGHAGFAGAGAVVGAFLALDAGGAHLAAIQWRDAMRGAGLAVATVNRRMSALRSVVQFARMIGRVTWTLEGLGLPRQAYRDTRGPGTDGYRAMLAAAATRPGLAGVRDVALVRLMFDNALRRSEVIGADVAHFDRDAGVLWIRGKKRTEREAVTLAPPTRAALAAWLDARGAVAPDAPLFVGLSANARGGRLTGEGVALIVRELARAAGLTRRVRPHGLRHAGITAALDATGGNVREVAKFSRHRSLATVALYDDARHDAAGRIAALVAAVA